MDNQKLFSSLKGGGPVDYLTTLKNAALADVQEKRFGFDYLLIDQLCLTILRGFHDFIFPVYSQLMPGYFEYETQLTYDVGFAFRFMEEALSVKFDHSLFTTFGKRAFEQAGDVGLERFLLPNLENVFTMPSSSSKSSANVSFSSSVLTAPSSTSSLSINFIPSLYKSIEKRYDYFLAACALRVDDLLISATLQKDFFTELLVFANMATEQNRLPPDWDWKQVVEKCLRYQGFDDDDAEDEYLGTAGLQMLRRSSSSVYGSTIYTEKKHGLRLYFGPEVYNPSEREQYWQDLAAKRDGKVYEAIGGRSLWPF